MCRFYNLKKVNKREKDIFLKEKLFLQKSLTVQEDENGRITEEEAHHFSNHPHHEWMLQKS